MRPQATAVRQKPVPKSGKVKKVTRTKAKKKEEKEERRGMSVWGWILMALFLLIASFCASEYHVWDKVLGMMHVKTGEPTPIGKPAQVQRKPVRKPQPAKKHFAAAPLAQKQAAGAPPKFSAEDLSKQCQYGVKKWELGPNGESLFATCNPSPAEAAAAIPPPTAPVASPQEPAAPAAQELCAGQKVAPDGSIWCPGASAKETETGAAYWFPRVVTGVVVGAIIYGIGKALFHHGSPASYSGGPVSPAP